MKRLTLPRSARQEIHIRHEARRMAALCREICFDLTLLATRWPLRLYPGLIDEAAESHASARELGETPCPS